jgi:hypothetical protein
MIRKIVFICFLLFFVYPIPTRANITYSYTGNPFTTVSDPSEGNSITMLVTFGEGSIDYNVGGDYGEYEYDNIISVIISSGPITTTIYDGAFFFENGNIIQWFVDSGIPNLELTSFYYPRLNWANDSVNGPPNQYINSESNFNSNDPGSWSFVSLVVTPEPCSLLLTVGSFLCLAGLNMVRKKFKPSVSRV